MSLGLPEQKSKSFWERPEGTTGMIALAAGAVGLYFIKDAILATLVTLNAIVGQTITLGLMGLVLFLILSAVTNRKLRTLVSYMFKSSMRWVTGKFVEIDPIGIMMSYIDELIGKRENMSESRDNLKGQLINLKRQIKENEGVYNQSMAEASVAQKQGLTPQFRVAAAQAGRMEKQNNETLIPLRTQMEAHMAALDKYYEVTGIVIDDMKNEVNARKIERKMMLASHTAMKAAMQILNGGTDSREIFDQAMEFVVEDFGAKMGMIDSFIEDSKGFVQGIDLQNGVFEATAMAKLADWDVKADNILSGKSKRAQLEHSTMTSPIVTSIGVRSPVSVGDYESLIGRK